MKISFNVLCHLSQVILKNLYWEQIARILPKSLTHKMMFHFNSVSSAFKINSKHRDHNFWISILRCFMCHLIVQVLKYHLLDICNISLKHLRYKL